MEARLEGRSLEVLEGCSVEESLRDGTGSPPGAELRFFPRRPRMGHMDMARAPNGIAGKRGSVHPWRGKQNQVIPRALRCTVT